MQVDPLNIGGVKLVRPRRFSDSRGSFSETYAKARYAEAGITDDFVQDNLSVSLSRGTVRGLHFQAPPAAQAKLVQCVAGRIFDVAVDLRAGSPTYGQWVSAHLTSVGGEQMYIPAGFAHGFMALEDGSVATYKVTDYYAPSAEGGLAWNDPGLAIDWPDTASAVVLSDRDQTWPAFAGFETPFTEHL